MNTNVTMIPVAQLHPHPDNPRKDLGDITELTASIKANGVLQNLTVVPRANPDVNYEELCRQYYADPTEENRTKLNQFRNTDGYTVIIGHRRLAAAKAAGLMELPCIVVEDMTLEEQISTMMTENMQRSDLTVYEEAEGFQMMMDFGNSVEQVADKAGFSESTIRRRVKLLSLDREAFKKSVKRGATLADFALLDKLDTEEAKNEVLKSVGTNNFRACLDRALREQKDRKTMNAIREVVASYATKADSKAAMPENCLFYGMPRAPGVSDKVGALAIAIVDMEERISYLKEQIAQQESKISAWISTIENDQTRQIFRMRFIGCLTWAEVAQVIGGRNTENGVKSVCYRYLGASPDGCGGE